MSSSQKATEVAKALAELIGLRLWGSRNFCATRHFYFASALDTEGLPLLEYTLGVECPWRIETRDRIVTGLEDYAVKADDNQDPAWQAGAPGGHLQDQKLRDFLGEMVDGGIVAKGTGHTVQSVVADPMGGFRIQFSGGHVLAVFPDSARRMEWIFQPPRGDSPVSLMLVNGALVRVPRCVRR